MLVPGRPWLPRPWAALCVLRSGAAARRATARRVKTASAAGTSVTRGEVSRDHARRRGQSGNTTQPPRHLARGDGADPRVQPCWTCRRCWGCRATSVRLGLELVDELPHRGLYGQGRVHLGRGEHPVRDVLQLRGLEQLPGPVDVRTRLRLRHARDPTAALACRSQVAEVSRMAATSSAVRRESAGQPQAINACQCNKRRKRRSEGPRATSRQVSGPQSVNIRKFVLKAAGSPTSSSSAAWPRRPRRSSTRRCGRGSASWSPAEPARKVHENLGSADRRRGRAHAFPTPHGGR